MNWEPSPSPAPEEQEEAPWYLRLVNLENRLPQDFTVELAQVDGGQFDARAAEALSQMLADMEGPGALAHVCSSFRTWEDQETLHQNKIDRLLEEGYSQEAAEAEASRWVVPAGASEHQLGLAADIVASQYQILEEEQENTPEQQWLMAHCQEYGFILRYPKDKTDGHRRGLRALALPLRGRGGRPGNHGPGDLPGGICGTGEKGLLRPERAGRPYTRPEQWGA